MNYLFGSITLILISTLGYFKTVEDTYASFQDWETNPIRYMIENPDGEYFEEAVLKRIEIIETEKINLGCMRLSIDVYSNTQSDSAIISRKLIPFDSIANTVLSSLMDEDWDTSGFPLNKKENISITSKIVTLDYNKSNIKNEIKLYKEVCRGVNLYQRYVLKKIKSNENIYSPHSARLFKFLSYKLDFFPLSKFIPSPPKPPFE